MTVYAITDTKKGEQGLRLLIFKVYPTSKVSQFYLLGLYLDVVVEKKGHV